MDPSTLMKAVWEVPMTVEKVKLHGWWVYVCAHS